MPLASTIAPPVAKSGTTNVSQITWKQRDNVVFVSVYGYSNNAGTYPVTGLPTPIGYTIARFINDWGYLGNMEYATSGWTINEQQSGKNIYGSFTYLTDEF